VVNIWNSINDETSRAVNLARNPGAFYTSVPFGGIDFLLGFLITPIFIVILQNFIYNYTFQKYIWESLLFVINLFKTIFRL